MSTTITVRTSSLRRAQYLAGVLRVTLEAEGEVVTAAKVRRAETDAVAILTFMPAEAVEGVEP